MKTLLAFLALTSASIWITVQAEPAIQAGDTLESLAQPKITVRTHSKVNTEQSTTSSSSTEDKVSVDQIDLPELDTAHQ